MTAARRYLIALGAALGSSTLAHYLPSVAWALGWWACLLAAVVLRDELTGGAK